MSTSNVYDVLNVRLMGQSLMDDFRGGLLAKCLIAQNVAVELMNLGLDHFHKAAKLTPLKKFPRLIFRPWRRIKEERLWKIFLNVARLQTLPILRRQHIPPQQDQ